eukprot:scaffold3145_cov101-Isochrysis_galbana.AAC.4
MLAVRSIRRPSVRSFRACLHACLPACQMFLPAFACRQSDDCLLLLLLLHICRQLDARSVPALLRARLPNARLLLPACCAGQMPPVR